MSNPKPPFGPVGLRRQEGPERVQAHTNNGGNCVHSARSWDGAEEPAPLFSQHADSWWFRTRVVQERGRSGRSSTGTLQQTYPNSSIHEMAEWIMTDPEQGLGLASLYNHLPLHGHPPLPWINMTNLMFIYLKHNEKEQREKVKKQCKINLELVLALMLPPSCLCN